MNKKLLLIPVMAFFLILLSGVVSAMKINESFEGVGTPTNWVVNSGSPDFDDSFFTKTGSENMFSDAGTSVDYNGSLSDGHTFRFWARLNQTNEELHLYPYDRFGVKFDTNGSLEVRGYVSAWQEKTLINYQADTDYLVYFQVATSSVRGVVYDENCTLLGTANATKNAGSSRYNFDYIGNGAVYVEDFRAWAGSIEQDPENYTCAGGGAAPVITFVYPEDNNNYNDYDGMMNWTTNIVSDNCTVNDTRWSYSMDNTTYWEWQNNTAIGDGNYTINISCWSGSDNGSSILDFLIDTVNPTITWNVPTNTNTTVVTSTLSTDVTLSDTNLYSYNYSILNSTGDLIINYTNSSLAGLTSYTINDTPNMTGYSGTFDAYVRVCDGHTAQLISFDNVGVVDKELGFDGVTVYSTDKSKDISVLYQKEPDRYNFNFITSLDSTTKSFVVESDEYIDILHGKTKYDGHLVTGNKWIDFEMIGTKSVVVSRVNDYKVLVTISTYLPTKNWNFNSVGELNCVEQQRQFFVVNTTESYDSQILSGDSTTFYLNVTYNSSFITSAINVTFYWNGTSYSSTGTNNSDHYSFSRGVTIPVVGSDQNISFYWKYTVNSVTYNTSNKTQEIHIPAIDNCTTYTTKFVNYSLRDELNDSVLTGDVVYSFYYSEGSYNGYYNNSGTGQTYYEFCIDPNWANFTTDITLQYSVTGYDTRDYVVDDFVADNSTEQITLYALASGQSTEITIHVTDENDIDLPNVFIQAYRWDIDTNRDLLVETEYTDSDGNAVFDLKTGSEYYSFNFSQSGEVVLSTTRFKIFSTTYDFVISETTTTRLSEWLKYNNGITRTLGYSNNTDIVNVNWSTSLTELSQFCLNVTGANFSQVYGNCSTSIASGSMSYTITNTNITHNAFFYVQSDSGNWYKLESLNIPAQEIWQIFGKNTGLILSILVFLVLGLLGMVNKNVMIISELGALIFLSMFGIMPLGWLGVTSIIIVGIVILIIINRRPSI